jgi:hypothetical protein
MRCPGNESPGYKMLVATPLYKSHRMLLMEFYCRLTGLRPLKIAMTLRYPFSGCSQYDLAFLDWLFLH